MRLILQKRVLILFRVSLKKKKFIVPPWNALLNCLFQQKDLAEKTLRSLTLEHEQVKSAFEAEKNRALSAEQELKTVMQAKTQSEQELTLAITGLNETKQTTGCGSDPVEG